MGVWGSEGMGQPDVRCECEWGCVGVGGWEGGCGGVSVGVGVWVCGCGCVGVGV